MAVAIVGSVISGVIGALSLTRRLTSRGRVVIITPPPPSELKFNVFEDVDCSVVLAEIDWGSLDPGETRTFLAYVKNYGDVPFNMALSTANWNPVEAEAFITPSWDYAGQTVAVGEVLPVTFTLTVNRGVCSL